MQLERPRSNYWKRFFTISGAIPLLFAYPLFSLILALASQIERPRVLGTLAVLCGFFGLVGLITALPANQIIHRKVLRFVFFILAVINLALIGLHVFFSDIHTVPIYGLLIALTTIATLMTALWCMPPNDRSLILRGLVLIGFVAWLIPIASLPIVGVAALQDRPPALAAPQLSPPIPNRPRRIILVTFDALRAQSTSLFNPNLANTSHLENLARESNWYTDCRAAGDQTLVSLLTILTGLRPSMVYPALHSRSFFLREGAVRGIAGYLKPAGYSANYATMFVNPEFFGQGMEYTSGFKTSQMYTHFNTAAFIPWQEIVPFFLNKLKQFQPRQNEMLAAQATVDRQLLEMNAATSTYSFHWLHIGVPHSPYYDVPATGPISASLRYPKADESAHISQDRLTSYQNVYERYVRFGDLQLGRLIANLKASGEWESTLLIVTSDHGESFNAQHSFHANGVTSEGVSHVPLIIHLPGQKREKRFDGLVAHEDLVPTILSTVYQAPQQEFVGRSLLSEAPTASRTVYCWGLFGRYFGGHPQSGQTIAAYHGKFKYMYDFKTHQDGLFDLQKDPHAKHDLSNGAPQIRDNLRNEICKDVVPLP